MQLKALVILLVVATCEAQGSCNRPGKSVTKTCNAINIDTCPFPDPGCPGGQQLTGYVQDEQSCPSGSVQYCVTRTTTVSFLLHFKN